jgi:hypothetical protein
MNRISAAMVMAATTIFMVSDGSNSRIGCMPDSKARPL